MDQPKRLYRSVTDRQIAGVCGGIGAYLGVDSTVVRLIFVLLAITGGPGLLLYIILALVIPEQPAYFVDQDEKPKRSTPDTDE